MRRTSQEIGIFHTLTSVDIPVSFHVSVYSSTQYESLDAIIRTAFNDFTTTSRASIRRIDILESSRLYSSHAKYHISSAKSRERICIKGERNGIPQMQQEIN